MQSVGGGKLTLDLKTEAQVQFLGQSTWHLSGCDKPQEGGGIRVVKGLNSPQVPRNSASSYSILFSRSVFIVPSQEFRTIFFH